MFRSRSSYSILRGCCTSIRPLPVGLFPAFQSDLQGNWRENRWFISRYVIRGWLLWLRRTWLLADAAILTLQTASIGALYAAWISITEGTLCDLCSYVALPQNLPYTSFHLTETWDDDYYPTWTCRGPSFSFRFHWDSVGPWSWYGLFVSPHDLLFYYSGRFDHTYLIFSVLFTDHFFFGILSRFCCPRIRCMFFPFSLTFERNFSFVWGFCQLGGSYTRTCIRAWADGRTCFVGCNGNGFMICFAVNLPERKLTPRKSLVFLQNAEI